MSVPFIPFHGCLELKGESLARSQIRSTWPGPYLVIIPCIETQSPQFLRFCSLRVDGLAGVQEHPYLRALVPKFHDKRTGRWTKVGRQGQDQTSRELEKLSVEPRLIRPKQRHYQAHTGGSPQSRSLPRFTMKGLQKTRTKWKWHL